MHVHGHWFCRYVPSDACSLVYGSSKRVVEMASDSLWRAAKRARLRVARVSTRRILVHRSSADVVSMSEKNWRAMSHWHHTWIAFMTPSFDDTNGSSTEMNFEDAGQASLYSDIYNSSHFWHLAKVLSIYFAGKTFLPRQVTSLVPGTSAGTTIPRCLPQWRPCLT
jgi:hypothetical protein